MITRSKLVEQLRDYQIRSQQKCPSLTAFSPKPYFTTWADVAVAIFWALVFCLLIISSFVALYYRHFRLAFLTLCLGIIVPLCLRSSRQALVWKRDRRLLLPLSM